MTMTKKLSQKVFFKKIQNCKKPILKRIPKTLFDGKPNKRAITQTDVLQKEGLMKY